MPITYVLDKIVIENFRGVDHLELNLRCPVPKILIGSNNAGKSTVLSALALVLNGGGFHQWSPTDDDFYCAPNGERSQKFSIKLHFWGEEELELPAVKAVGDPVPVHGIEVIGSRKNTGRCEHKRRLFDRNGRAITVSRRTPLKAADRVAYADHDIGFKLFNARLDDIREHLPTVWLFRPQNLEASLYLWKTGPIARLSKLLADRFAGDSWDLDIGEGKQAQKMPDAMHRGYRFFQTALQRFPFWRDDMKPHLEEVFDGYVGSHAKIDLQPNPQEFADWIAQQLMISLATDPESAPTTLKSMGDGWQSVIRLASLEAMSKYPELVRERVVLLLEEPETHLHPHLRRKIRKVFGRLAAAGWTVIYSTHSTELVSFAEKQEINRLVRHQGRVKKGTIQTSTLDNGARFQSNLDKGAHDFLFSTAAIFMEGQDDTFAAQLALEKADIDCDARSVSMTRCGGASGIPAFAQIASQLGIRFFAITDEDRLPDGSIKPATHRARERIAELIKEHDAQSFWPGCLEEALNIPAPQKAIPEVTNDLLSNDDWETIFPNFAKIIEEVADWIRG